jgi:hypothetical protein
MIGTVGNIPRCTTKIAAQPHIEVMAVRAWLLVKRRHPIMVSSRCFTIPPNLDTPA